MARAVSAMTVQKMGFRCAGCWDGSPGQLAAQVKVTRMR